jgi:hypothetical protein
VKPAPIKPRLGGRKTESQFWGEIRSALRRKWMMSPVRADVLNAATRKLVKPRGRQRVETQCAACQGWFARKQVDVDHVIQCGALNAVTAGQWIERLFVEAHGLQVLCDECHNAKTKAERATKQKPKRRTKQ